jgi:4-amino-4-deoxy-L-arabinose transferase-like glycosyltransferase
MHPEYDHFSFGFEEGRVARSIVQGHGFGNPLFLPSGLTAWFAPIYPYLLAGIFKVFGVYTLASALVAVGLNCVFSALTCIPIFYIALKSFNRRTAVLAAWGWALIPYAIYYPVIRVWDTWLATLLLATVFLLVLHLEETSSAWVWAGFGALSGVAALTSPVVLAALAPLGLWMAYRLYRQRKPFLLPAATAVFCVIAVCTPWFIRNYVTFHEFIPIGDSLGLEFWVGNNGDTSYLYSKPAGPWHTQSEWLEYRDNGELSYFNHKGEQAKEYISNHPGWYIGTVLRRVVNVWTEYWSFDKVLLKDFPYEPIIVPLATILSIFTLLGLRDAFKKNFNAAMPYAIVLFFFPLIYYFTHTGDWYRRPIDPMFVILALFSLSVRFGSKKSDAHKHPELHRLEMAETQ